MRLSTHNKNPDLEPQRDGEKAQRRPRIVTEHRDFSSEYGDLLRDRFQNLPTSAKGIGAFSLVIVACMVCSVLAFALAT